jgi:hypothetical protein
LNINPENGELIATHFSMSTEGEKQQDNLKYDHNVPILIISEGQLHCVPVLYKVPSEELSTKEGKELCPQLPEQEEIQLFYRLMEEKKVSGDNDEVIRDDCYDELLYESNPSDFEDESDEETEQEEEDSCNKLRP